MKVVGIAGMPGSGKSRLMQHYEADGYHRFDDINSDWPKNIKDACSRLARSERLIISDILFCRQDFRERLAAELGTEVHWVFFENNPFQCALNVLHRRFVEGHDRPWGREMQLIHELCTQYSPIDPLPVTKAARLTPVADNNAATGQS